MVAFQNLNKEIRMENNEQTPPPQEENDKEKGELEYEKGKELEQNTPQVDPRVDRKEP